MRSLAHGILTIVLAAAANGATISGTVTSDSGFPLTAMTVAAYTTAGVLAATGGTTLTGTYAITLPAASYHVLAYDPAGTFATSFYADAESFDTSASITVTTSQNAANINFRLARSGFIVGRVSSIGGTSLPNITVVAYNLSGTRRGFTSTDSTGSYTLALPPGSFKVVAYDDALTYATTFFDDATSFPAATPMTVVSTDSITANVRLPLAAKVTGSIADRATLAPLAAMRVTAYGSDGSIAGQSITGSDGGFAMAARPGTLRVVVDDPSGNYATTYVPDAESFSMETAVTATAAQTLSMNATMVRGGRLAGKITDRLSGSALPNITAAAYNADGTIRSIATSDASGAYSIVVPPADLRVGVYDSALIYLPLFYPNQTTFGTATTQHAIAQQSIGAINFALSKGARVAAHVTSKTSGAPLPSITVAAYDTAGFRLASATTDSSGNCALLLNPATVKLLAFDASLQFATSYYLDATTFDSAQALALSEGQSLDTSFSMLDAGRISGILSDATTAAPLGGILVIVYDVSFQRVVETTTDTAGNFRLAVPEGTYFVAAADPAHYYGTLFYPASTTTASASSVSVSAGQDVGPLAMHLTIASIPPRRRAARH